MKFAAGGAQPQKIYSATVYDPSGRIIHMHHVVVFEGTTVPSQKRIEALALEHASKAGHATKGSLVANTDEPGIAAGGDYRIDVQKKMLVPMPRKRVSPA